MAWTETVNRLQSDWRSESHNERSRPLCQDQILSVGWEGRGGGFRLFIRGYSFGGSSTSIRSSPSDEATRSSRREEQRPNNQREEEEAVVLAGL